MTVKRSRTKAVPIKSRIRKVSEFRQPDSWCFYGKSGSGKTTIASTFPGPRLLIDVKDQGTASVSDVENMDVFPVESRKDLDDLYWELAKGSLKGKYKTIIVDTFTQLQQICVNEAADTKGGEKYAGDWGTMSKQKWGAVAADLKNLVVDYRDLPGHTIFLAQEKLFEGEDGMDDFDWWIAPEAMPSLSSHLCASVGVVGHLEVKKIKAKKKKPAITEYRLRLVPDNVYIAKMRKPKSVQIPEWIEDPTFAKLKSLNKGK